jgi:hypothetical protein
MLLKYFLDADVYVRLAVTGVRVTQGTQILLRLTLGDRSQLWPAIVD